MDEGTIANDYDGAWKEILDGYLESFLGLCFPEVHRELDFSAPPTALEQELQQLFPKARKKAMRVDKLYRIKKRGGKSELFLLHLELQASRDRKFPERMLRYHYRIFERWRERVTSLAVLADLNPDWHPQSFELETLGTRLSFQFPTCKLLELEKNGLLETVDTPVKLLIQAHLASLRTKGEPLSRFSHRLNLAKILVNKGWNREQIRKTFHSLQWLLLLPEPLEVDFHQTIQQYFKEENKMAFVSIFERVGMQKGIEQGIEQGLEKGRQEGQVRAARESVLEALQIRFGKVPRAIEERIEVEDDMETLKNLHKRAITVESLKGF